MLWIAFHLDIAAQLRQAGTFRKFTNEPPQTRHFMPLLQHS